MDAKHPNQSRYTVEDITKAKEQLNITTDNTTEADLGEIVDPIPAPGSGERTKHDVAISEFLIEQANNDVSSSNIGTSKKKQNIVLYSTM